MPKFKITFQQIIDIDIDDKKYIRQLLKADPPFLDVAGAGFFNTDESIGYRYKTRKNIKIMSIESKTK